MDVHLRAEHRAAKELETDFPDIYKDKAKLVYNYLKFVITRQKLYTPPGHYPKEREIEEKFFDIYRSNAGMAG